MNEASRSPQNKNKPKAQNRVALAKTGLTIGSLLALLGGWVALAKAEPSANGNIADATVSQPSAAVQTQLNSRGRSGAPPEKSAQQGNVPRASAAQALPTSTPTPEAARNNVAVTPVPQATATTRATTVAPTATPRAAVAAQPTAQARAQPSQRPAPSTRTRSSR